MAVEAVGKGIGKFVNSVTGNDIKTVQQQSADQYRQPGQRHNIAPVF